MSCQHCGVRFAPRDCRQLYCSASCRVMACRQRRGRLARQERQQWAARHWRPGPIPPSPPWPHHEVPVAVVAHPDRAHLAHRLAEEVFAEAVLFDDADYGCEINHLRAWEWLAGGNCPWSVVIEDDAVPVTRFRHQLHAALQAARTPIVSLYLGRVRPPHWQSRIAEAVGRARLHDVCFLRASELLHAVGYAIRTALLPDMLAELPALVNQMPIDEAVSTWARQRDHQISYTWPSLLDHRDGPSLLSHPDGQHRRRGRVAWYADARERWSSTVGQIEAPDTLIQEVG